MLCWIPIHGLTTSHRFDIGKLQTKCLDRLTGQEIVDVCLPDAGGTNQAEQWSVLQS